MTKNKDGHWQMPGNAANYAAGLGVSTATHGCSDRGMLLCQTSASFFGIKDTNTTQIIDKINQTTDFIDKVSDSFDKYLKHPIYKTGSYLINFGSRFDDAYQYCKNTCDKERWEIDGYGGY